MEEHFVQALVVVRAVSLSYSLKITSNGKQCNILSTDRWGGKRMVAVCVSFIFYHVGGDLLEFKDRYIFYYLGIFHLLFSCSITKILDNLWYSIMQIMLPHFKKPSPHRKSYNVTIFHMFLRPIRSMMSVTIICS
jgi:hypothetical protein